MTKTEAAAALAEAARKHSKSISISGKSRGNERQELDDAIAAYDAAAEDDGWRPIESAPKDGRMARFVPIFSGQKWRIRDYVSVCLYPKVYDTFLAASSAADELNNPKSSAAAERAAIVAWLDSMAKNSGDTSGIWAKVFADAIERGYHGPHP